MYYNNGNINCFNNKLLKRSSCLDCKFNGFHRVCDCTIGDFWGDERFQEQHHEGLSVIVFHTDRLKELLVESTLRLSEISWNELIKCNPCYYWSHYPYLQRSISRNIALHNMKKVDIHKSVLLNIIYSLLSKMELGLYYRINSKKKVSLLKRVFN